MKKKGQLPAGLIAILLISAAVVLLVRNFYVEDFCIIEPGVLYTSGQPRGMDYTRLLYKYHITTIVNIRPTFEHQEQNWRNEEITWTRSHGVNYLEMPIEKGRYFPDDQIQEQFLALMANKNNLPVLLHGSSDDKRIAMLVAAWLGRSHRYTSEQILNAVTKIIDDRPLTQEEIKFVNEMAK